MFTTLILSACAFAQSPHVAPVSPEYLHAFEVAKVENRRVLLIHETADAKVNEELSKLLKSRKIGRELMYEYAKLRISLEDAKPNAAVLEIYPAEGAMLASISVEQLRNEEGHLNAAALMAFLQKHEATPWNAMTVLETARLEAVKSNKRLFVHLGAPW